MLLSIKKMTGSFFRYYIALKNSQNKSICYNAILFTYFFIFFKALTWMNFVIATLSMKLDNSFKLFVFINMNFKTFLYSLNPCILTIFLLKGKIRISKVQHFL